MDVFSCRYPEFENIMPIDRCQSSSRDGLSGVAKDISGNSNRIEPGVGFAVGYA
jgi:hypothetical protein